MCSIVGYVGSHGGIAYVFESLRRLEYRGYDSAGCAGITKSAMHVHKQVGGVSRLIDAWHHNQFDTPICIGHTRWATHGGATQHNAHPHTNSDTSVAVVHNGIIDNERHIRDQLDAEGYVCTSETDSELIAHLFDREYARTWDVVSAFFHTVRQIEGAYAICLVTTHDPSKMLLARQRSPLCIGVGDGCTMVASDIAGCAVAADRVIHMPEHSCAVVQADMVSLYDIDGAQLSWHTEPIDHNFIAADTGGYEHYMLKEIYEQKRVVRDTIDWYAQRRDTLSHELGMSDEQIRDWQSVTMAACGTSYFAGSIGSYYMQDIAEIPSYAWIASEFLYRRHFLADNDCFMVLSQSGETADTLQAMRSVKASGGTTIGMVNVPASSIEREADGRIYTHAKQEISVASTKSFMAQVSSLYWFAHYVAYHHGTCNTNALEQAEQAIIRAAEQAEEQLVQYTPVLRDYVAPRYAQTPYCIFLGKHIMYPLAQEAALKLQEIAYIPSFAYPSGELKHGPLALLYEGIPVVLISSPDSELYNKILASAQEVRARGGHLIVCAFAGQDTLIELAHTAFVFPQLAPEVAPIVVTPVLQAFAYYIARHASCPIDKPRNLAKSVTVE